MWRSDLEQERTPHPARHHNPWRGRAPPPPRSTTRPAVVPCFCTAKQRTGLRGGPASLPVPDPEIYAGKLAPFVGAMVADLPTGRDLSSGEPSRKPNLPAPSSSSFGIGTISSGRSIDRSASSIQDRGARLLSPHCCCKISWQAPEEAHINASALHGVPSGVSGPDGGMVPTPTS